MGNNPFAMKLPVVYAECSSSYRRLVREEYVRVQKGLCLDCGKPLDGPPSEYVQKALINTSLFPQGFFDHPIHLHHDHDTGLTIGALHARCNAYSWQHKGK